MASIPRNYQKGDIVSIRIDEKAAYELGCGEAATMVFKPEDITNYVVGPRPVKRILVVLNNGDNCKYSTIKSALNDFPTAEMIIRNVHCYMEMETNPGAIGSDALKTKVLTIEELKAGR